MSRKKSAQESEMPLNYHWRKLLVRKYHKLRCDLHVIKMPGRNNATMNRLSAMTINYGGPEHAMKLPADSQNVIKLASYDFELYIEALRASPKQL